MGDHTKLEWVVALARSRDAIPATWNPIRGCRRRTEGCRNCFAAAIAYRYKGVWGGLADLDPQGVPRFNGTVRLVETALAVPLRARKPRVYFVCDMADLFGDGVPDAWIDRVFATMAQCPQHLFLLLTKRPERMRAYLAGLPARRAAMACDAGLDWCEWPLPNVWGGASIHDQDSANAFVPEVLAAPLAGRFVSAEPLLGPSSLTRLVLGDLPVAEGVDPRINRMIFTLDALRGAPESGIPRLDWVIAGGESGPKARPMHPDWARGLRDQCTAVGTPFFFKQWGALLPGAIYTAESEFGCDDVHWMDGSSSLNHEGIDLLPSLAVPTPEGCAEAAEYERQQSEGAKFFDGNKLMAVARTCSRQRCRDRQGCAKDGLPWMWVFKRVGKGAAGRLLDGAVHDGVPEVSHAS